MPSFSEIPGRVAKVIIFGVIISAELHLLTHAPKVREVEILHKFDELDMRILSELTRDASISVPRLSKKLNINASVLYSRIKRLSKRSLVKKFTVIVNESMLGINVKATVGINRDPKLKEPIHGELMKIPEVRAVSEVTGRFDMIVTVSAHTLEELHNVVIERIGKIEGIQNTETFVEMQRTEKEPNYTAQSGISR
jgi:Lrp/AsnC family transcriptional regulator for asnA, asnC and gidA